MSANTAELTLIVKAQNLAETELAKVRASMSKITLTAKQVALDVAQAFKGVAGRIGRQLGSIATDLLSGGSLTNNMVFLGATMAGAIVEGLAVHLIPGILARIGALAVFAPISAAFAAGGVTAGLAFDTAVAVTMAALPFVILAIAVAALVYLAANPEARQKAREVALMIIGRVGDGLRTLGKVLFDAFQRGMARANDAAREGIANVVRLLLSIPGRAVALVLTLPGLFRRALLGVLGVARAIVDKIIDAILAIPRAIAKALEAIGKLSGATFTVSAGRTPRHAEGGWVGLHGPELGLLGEKGPEYVVPNHQLKSMGSKASPGFTIQGVSERQIIDMVERGLYFRLRRAAPTLSRT